MSKLAFQGLLDRYLLGEASTDELAELERRLRAERSLRRRLVDEMILEAQLHRALSAVADPSPPTARKADRVASRRRPWTIAAATVGFVAILVTVGFALRPGSDQVPQPAENVVASGSITSADGSTKVLVFDRPLTVTGESPAVLQLTDGSHVELKSGTRLTISEGRDHRPAIAMTEGEGNFRVAKGGVPFVVTTPTGTITVLGTEFRVRLPNAGKGGRRATKLEVAVRSGSVRVDVGSKSYVLTAGEERRYGDDGEQNDNNNDDGEQNNRDDGSKRGRNK